MSAVKKLYLSFAAVIVTAIVAVGAPVISFAHPLDVTPLNNKDVLQMVEKKLSAETIVQTIKASPCTFDTFPSVMKELKRRGVPEEVLEAMLDAPYGPAEQKQSTEDLADEPIYHFTETIKQYLVTPTSTGRRYTPSMNRRSARSTRVRR
jgi:hypothetical protein